MGNYRSGKEISSTIREHFKPVQPIINFDDDVSYEEITPGLPLGDFIFCYWRLHTRKPLEKKFSYKIVADGCIDIFLEATRPIENYVMGFCKSHSEFFLESTFNYFGIRFLPVGFARLFNIDASELTDKVESLNMVLPAISKELVDMFDDENTLLNFKNKADTYFLSILRKSETKLDTRLVKAMEQILQRRGILSIEQDLNTELGPRQLRRLFNFYIGASPKTFSQVIRFQTILNATQTNSRLRFSMSFDDGYFDQAHFIKEFRRMSGLTPGAFK